MTKYIIIAAALFGLCAPAWATDRGHHGGSSGIGGTTASSTSGAEAGGEGKSYAKVDFSNKSRGSNKGGESVTSSKSRGEGESTRNGGWSGYSTGTADAFTFGGFGHH